MFANSWWAGKQVSVGDITALEGPRQNLNRLSVSENGPAARALHDFFYHLPYRFTATALGTRGAI
jgi:hypothetical protein